MLLAGPAIALTPPPPVAEPFGPELRLDGGDAAVRLSPAVAVRGDGGFAVAWIDAGGGEVRLRFFAADARPLGGDLRVGTAPVGVLDPQGLPAAARRIGPRLALLDEATLLVVWVTGCPGESAPPAEGPVAAGCPQLLGRRFAWGGLALGPAFVVAAGEGAYLDPRVAALAGHRFAVAWTREPLPPAGGVFGAHAASGDVFARLYAVPVAPHAAATPLTPALAIAEDDEGDQRSGGIAPLAGGGFVVVWESDEGADAGFEVLQRRFAPGGQPASGALRVGAPERRTADQREPAVAALAAGGELFGHAIVWTDYGYDQVAGSGTIALRSFDADGTPDVAELIVHEDAGGHQSAPDVAASGSGVVVAFLDQQVVATPSGPVTTRRVLASYLDVWLSHWGVQALDRPLAAGGAALDPSLPAVAAGPSQWLAVWVGSAGAAAGSQLHGRRVGFGPPAPPPPSLVLAEHFRAEVAWATPDGAHGHGQPAARGAAWGTFWFFSPDNVEIAVKVVDGRELNGRYWVFAASLTNVAFTLRVSDTVSGLAVQLFNPPGLFASQADTWTLVGSLPAAATVTAPPPADRERGPGAAAERTCAAVAGAAPGPLDRCAAGASLVGGRFDLEVEWEAFDGSRGVGEVAALTADTAWVWFFAPDNPELLVKVLDARTLNGHYWVFFGALTNVGFRLTVTDRATGASATYHNPLGRFASHGDTEALPGD